MISLSVNGVMQNYDKKVRNVQGIGKNNGVTYALDKVLRKKLEKIRDDYLQELEDRELENEKSLIDKQIYARKINKAFNSLILNKISKIKYLQAYRERIVDGELYKSINKDVYSYCKKIAFAVVSNVYHDVVVPITDKNNNLITEKIYMNAVSAADSRKEFEYEYYSYVVDFANKHGIYLGKITDNFDDVSKLLDYSYGNGQSEFVYTLDNKDMFIFKLVDYVMSSKGSSYTEDIDLFKERYKNRIDFDKVVEIVKDKIGVSNIKELNTEQRDTFDGICIACAYYVMIVKYCASDVFTDMNELSIKLRVPNLLRYDIITEVVNELSKNKVITGEILNNVSTFQKVDEGVLDPYKNKSKIPDIVASLQKLDDILV